MSYNYIVTAHKPTAATASVTGSFLSPNERNLIVAKNTRLEVSTMTSDGVKPVKEVNIYGRISVMKKLRYPQEQKDLLFFLTDKYDVAILEFTVESPDGFEVVTRSQGCVVDPYARPSEAGSLVAIDQPRARLIALRLYDGLLKIIPLNREARELRSFNIRMDEAQVVDMCLLANFGGSGSSVTRSCSHLGSDQPTLVVVHEEQQSRHLKTHVISLRERELVKGPWAQCNLDCDAEMLIPVDDADSGVIIVGGETIVYYWGADYVAVAPALMLTTKLLCYCEIDTNRYILGGICGRIFVLVLGREGRRVTEVTLELLGNVSTAECLSYLDNGVMFVGSRLGDSQLVRICEQPPFIEVLESYTNLGPIVDMVVVDLEKQGQSQLVTCSGSGVCGTLRIIRNGIGINELACVDLAGITGIWPLRLSPLAAEASKPTESGDSNDAFSHRDDALVLSFAGQTRIFKCISAEELEQISFSDSLSQDSETLYAYNVMGDQVVQITDRQVHLVCLATKTKVDAWCAPEGTIITKGTCNSVQIALALQNELVYLEIQPNKLVEKKRRTLEYEIACLDVNPLYGEGEFTSWIAVGLWTWVSIRMFFVPDLTEAFCQQLPQDLIPRSVLKITFEETSNYLLCTLADGSLFYYIIGANGVLSRQKRVTLGTQPTTLRKFRSQNTWSVFACSDIPTVIYSSNSKLVFSKVNLREVKHMCSFSSEAFPDTLAFASEDEFVIGTIDAIQKLHIRTIRLGESPKRIAYQEETGTFGVLVCRSEMVSLNQSGTATYRSASLDAPNKSHVSTFSWHRDFLSFGSSTVSERSEGGNSAAPSGSNAPGNSGLHRPPVCDEIYSLLIIDQNTFEVLHAMQFCPNEFGVSICSARLHGDPHIYYVVGTTFVSAEESDPKIGRIIVLRWHDGRLETITERETAGAPYCIREFQGRLVASVNSTVRIYSWSSNHYLENECTHFHNIISLYLKCHGNFILVGDLMRSLTLLYFHSGITALEELGRDYQTNWMTAVEILDEDTFLGAETNMNLYVCKRDPSAACDLRPHMNEVALFRLGEMVNVFARGSLVMAQPMDTESLLLPISRSFLYGSVHGAVGVLVPIKQELYETLLAIQNNLAKVIKSVGHIEHKFWRTFVADRKVEPAVGFIDGDLIEQLLDLSRDALASVAQGVIIPDHGTKRAATPDDLIKLVEELTRIH